MKTRLLDCLHHSLKNYKRKKSLESKNADVDSSKTIGHSNTIGICASSTSKLFSLLFFFHRFSIFIDSYIKTKCTLSFSFYVSCWIFHSPNLGLLCFLKKCLLMSWYYFLVLPYVHLNSSESFTDMIWNLDKKKKLKIDAAMEFR